VFTARYSLHSTFCPHSVFMCFVWIWEQTAIISLYSIDWLIFVTEIYSALCEVVMELENTYCLGEVHTSGDVPWFRWSVAALSPSSPGFDLSSICVRFCVAHNVLGEVSFRVHHYSPVSAFRLLLHTHLRLNTTLIRRTSGRNLKL